MCEIFPEVENCCFVCSYRIGLLFISVTAIITGSISLSAMHISKKTNNSFEGLKNVSNIRAPGQAYSAIKQIIPSGVSAISVLFMLMGLLLLFATLMDSDGFVQIFVWGTFLTVVFSFILVFLIICECMLKDVCTLSDMDWLSGSALLVIIIGYLFLWIYFISVANSYAINGN